MTFKNREGSYDLLVAFEPDILLSDQYYTTLRKSHLGNPERRLMAAVLEDAVACLSVNPALCSRRQARDFFEAQAWINGTEDSEWVFSFANVCELLGIDASYLRRGLTRWCERQDTHSDQTNAVRRAAGRHKQLRLRAGL
jgi:hypothetical protein